MLGKPHMQKTENLSKLDSSFLISDEPLGLQSWELD